MKIACRSRPMRYGFTEVQAQPLPVAPFQLLATGRAPS
jgi:hypothetical protein